MIDLLFESATDARKALRGKDISAVELVTAVLDRIDAVNPALNAVVELRRDEALREAAAADQVLASGVDVGPLHGIPITVKEAINVAGMRTTWGNPAFAEYVADADATAVRRLKDAGAIVVGKTNVAMMLGDFAQTENPIYGVTNNPWNLSHTPGGSSGGAAAAISAGLSFLELGSDLVGSIRIPASFCGVYGLRPSVHTVPLTGFQPPGPPALASDRTYLSALGPMARSAGDLRTALAVAGGPENPAAQAFSWRLPAPRHERLRDFRVGVVLDHDGCPVTSEVGMALSNAVDALAQSGATIVEGWPKDIDPMRSAESFGFHVQLFFAHAQPGAEMPEMSAVVEQEKKRMAYRAAWASYFGDVDVFLCPTNFTAAFPPDDRPFEQRTIATDCGERRYDEQPFWTAHPALAGLPAVSAPIGRTPSGLPVGAQIVGPQHEDDTAITFAELAADIIGGFERLSS
ncbi:MAG: amidase [Sciscionella sp.]|nr:amidase [Sciscionella sp.]